MNRAQKKKMMELGAKIQRPVVEAIRACNAVGMKRSEMMAKFGLSGSVITNIVRNHTYTYYD